MRVLRELPDHRLLDTLLRSRAWIWLLGIALGGVVAMQVSLLKMNAGIGVDVQRSTDLQHANAMLEEQVAELSSGDRIQAAAQRMGLIVPDAGAVGYLTVRPGMDPGQAARTMTAPSQAAREDLLQGGRTASTPVAPATTTATTTTATTATPVATATAAPVATATPAPVVTATPVPTVVAPVTAPATPQSTAGAAAAPSGQ
jgi:cell division protein FtsB